jgi:hypothetical protein
MNNLCIPCEPKTENKCLHGKRKSRCVDCGGSAICEHKKIKIQCKACGGSQICIHNKMKTICKECGGGSFCEHNKKRSVCKECNGTNICEHNKLKQQCKDCHGTRICVHNIQISNCFSCKGSNICSHNKRKPWCKECGGSMLCKSSWCDKKKQIKYECHCLTCFIYLFPDEPNARNYKTKEKDVVDRITQTFTSFTWVADKKVQDGCSRPSSRFIIRYGFSYYYCGG